MKFLFVCCVQRFFLFVYVLGIFFDVDFVVGVVSCIGMEFLEFCGIVVLKECLIFCCLF